MSVQSMNVEDATVTFLPVSDFQPFSFDREARRTEVTIVDGQNVNRRILEVIQHAWSKLFGMHVEFDDFLCFFTQKSEIDNVIKLLSAIFLSEKKRDTLFIYVIQRFGCDEIWEYFCESFQKTILDHTKNVHVVTSFGFGEADDYLALLLAHMYKNSGYEVDVLTDDRYRTMRNHWGKTCSFEYQTSTKSEIVEEFCPTFNLKTDIQRTGFNVTIDDSKKARINMYNGYFGY
jgi:hypothetical protein